MRSAFLTRPAIAAEIASPYNDSPSLAEIDVMRRNATPIAPKEIANAKKRREAAIIDNLCRWYNLTKE
jgi:hypothetical protein